MLIKVDAYILQKERTELKMGKEQRHDFHSMLCARRPGLQSIVSEVQWHIGKVPGNTVTFALCWTE